MPIADEAMQRLKKAKNPTKWWERWGPEMRKKLDAHAAEHGRDEQSVADEWAAVERIRDYYIKLEERA